MRWGVAAKTAGTTPRVRSPPALPRRADTSKRSRCSEILLKTWVTHLLFIFWNDASRSAWQYRADSRLPNPGIRFGFQNLDWAAIRERSAFKDQLLSRDGYRCIATGKADERYPHHENERYCLGIRTPQVILPFLAFNLLRDYLSEKTLRDMEDSVDDPANGLLLSCESRHGFSRFNWCLEETDYKLEIYGGAHGLSGMRPGDSKIIEFGDRSAEFQAGQPEPVGKHSCEERHEIPVPDPRYLRIHAAIAGVLHMSGAGKFFYEIVREWYEDEEGFSAVQSWEELERVVDVAELEEQLPAISIL
ncbi:hypothetical protein BD779DRAFT_1676133 [Infundibulicybe gibba]|nr:hypothetical protein BD779DRAFT_1676133 [Infundibulicybe gibba]